MEKSQLELYAILKEVVSSRFLLEYWRLVESGAITSKFVVSLEKYSEAKKW